MSKENRKRKFTLPKGRRAIVYGVILALVLIGAVFVYKATSDFIAAATIFNPGGVPVLNESKTDPDTTALPGEPTSTPLVPLDTFTMPEAWDGKSRVNLLVMGLDARSIDANVILTDTMILFTLDPVANTAGMISIPRDLWVKIPGGNYAKINTAYSVGEIYQLPGGGPALAAKTVENLLGVPVHYYAQIDFQAFVEFIDLIDGVKITPNESVQLNIIDTDFSQWIEPGITVTLPGELALAYVRYRDRDGGDIARSQRQQQVILAVRDRILDFNMLPSLIQRAPQLYASLSRGINSNLSLQQIIQFGIKVLNDVPRENIVHAAIGWQQVTPGNSDGQAILRPIPDKIREIRDQVFTGSSVFDDDNFADLQSILQQEAATVSILNGSSQTGLAERASTYLQEQGIHVTNVGNAAYTASSTLTYYGAKPYTIRYLKEFAGISQDYHIFYAYDPTIDPQIVLVLGDDFITNSKLPQN